MIKYCAYLIVILAFVCGHRQSSKEIITNEKTLTTKPTSLVILGTLQDGGAPHIGCIKECCRRLFENPDPDRQVVSLGLYDSESNKRYLFEATPDLPRQMKALMNYGISNNKEIADGIFITHAHIGHYTGLMYLGKEAADTRGINVYAMPRMKEFIETNGPWSQLVSHKNIAIKQIDNEQPISLSENLSVTPLLVPHRDEYAETVGYIIKGPNKSALFIPDIDKWEKWEKNIIEEVKKVDYAFLDATFYSGDEIDTRDISQIPHPFIVESLEKFNGLDSQEKNKIIFIHFNHTNPVINPASDETKNVLSRGYRIARINDIFEL